MATQSVTLADNNSIPLLGFGVYQISLEETEKAVSQALEVGYRHIDTAQLYGNEAETGAAIRNSGIAREDIFVTSKIWPSSFGDGRSYAAVEQSLERMGLDYLDLMLLHQPFGDTYGAWRDLIKAREQGLVRSIGISNFSPYRAVDLGLYTGVMPVINQIEIHPLHQRREEIDQLREADIYPEAWAPFGRGRSGLFENPVLSAIGEKYGKTTAQVMLRWQIQRDIIVVAKSAHKDRIAQNFEIFDFELTAEDMEQIAALDTKTTLFHNHETVETVRRFFDRA